jgi:hypothetical protein
VSDAEKLTAIAALLATDDGSCLSRGRIFARIKTIVEGGV